MKPEDFDFVAKLLKERSGLVLSKDKSYLLESRLMPVARRRGMKGLDELVAAVRRMDAGLVKDVTEAMTTNESFFFRDGKPFDQFREQVIPNLLQSRKDKRAIRIWCAACSSGQEPYSLAIILKELESKLAGWRIDIIATDLSTEILEKAKAGLYSQFEVQRGMPIQLLVKYFQKKDEMWQIDPRLRAMVQFRPLNLLTDIRSPLGTFDVVYCRNVLIYFDQDTKGKVLADIAKLLTPDGCLFLGGAETVLGISDKFKPIVGQRGMYQLTDAATAKV